MIKRKLIVLIGIIALLFSTLACRAATSLIIPDTPAPQPTPTHTLIPTLLPVLPTTTPEFTTACPVLLEDIVSASLESSESEENDEQVYFVLYNIIEDKLDRREDITDNNGMDPKLDSTEAHEALWDYFAALIAPEYRPYLTKFAITSDGRGNILAAVEQTPSNPTKWTLEVDIVDSEDYYSLTFTLLHEYGHLFTLAPNQVPPDRDVFYHPGDGVYYDKALDACSQYFTGEGCSRPESYINEFFNRFWVDFYDEWKVIDKIKDDDEYYNELDDFYDKYQDQFLTDYSATSPEEDIAEAFAIFVLSPKPSLDSIANEKLLFFYEHPELVKVRQDILGRLCEEFPQ